MSHSRRKFTVEVKALIVRRHWAGKEPVSKLAEEFGVLKGVWVPHDTRDEIVDYIHHWTERAELPAKRLLGWLEYFPE